MWRTQAGRLVRASCGRNPALSGGSTGYRGGVPTLSNEVQEAFRTLPTRYLGASPGFDATYHVCLADVGHTWEVRCTTHGARVRMGATRREPDVTIGTDAQTWLQLRQGELSGLEAFSQRRLYARGAAPTGGWARTPGPGCRGAGASSRAWRPSPSGACTRAASWPPRWASRACPPCPAAARRCCASTTSPWDASTSPRSRWARGR